MNTQWSYTIRFLLSNQEIQCLRESPDFEIFTIQETDQENTYQVTFLDETTDRIHWSVDSNQNIHIQSECHTEYIPVVCIQ